MSGTGAIAPEAAARRAETCRRRLAASRVLLASHDTAGARAAEAVALDALVPGGHLHHLVIVPEFWAGMTGDGWRCNGSNVRDFADYLESQIEREIAEHLGRAHAEARRRGIVYSAGSKHGPLDACLIEASREADYDVVVIGSRRPRGMLGFRSHMRLDRLAQSLGTPLVVVPHPARAGPRDR